MEHVDTNITQSVYGIDINPDYLETAFERYKDKIAFLQLLNLDIARNTGTICRADFIWAALILEYTGIDKALAFCTNNICEGGHLIISIQSNNNTVSVSSTGIETVKKAGELFLIVSSGDLLRKAGQAGFDLIGREENFLPNGKSIITFHFILI